MVIVWVVCVRVCPLTQHLRSDNVLATSYRRPVTLPLYSVTRHRGIAETAPFLCRLPLADDACRCSDRPLVVIRPPAGHTVMLRRACPGQDHTGVSCEGSTPLRGSVPQQDASPVATHRPMRLDIQKHQRHRQEHTAHARAVARCRCPHAVAQSWRSRTAGPVRERKERRCPFFSASPTWEKPR